MNEISKTTIDIKNLQRSLQHLKDKEEELKEIDIAVFQATGLDDLDQELNGVRKYEDDINDCVDEAEKAIEESISATASTVVDTRGIHTGYTTPVETTNHRQELPGHRQELPGHRQELPGHQQEAGHLQEQSSQQELHVQEQVPSNEQETVTIERNRNNNAFSSHLRLPKLNLEPFHGDPSKWLCFWDLFKTTIHQNGSLTKVDKFSYLKSYLREEAVNSIAGLALTGVNYDKAVSILIERFGSEDKIINAHMNNITNISPVRQSSDLVALRNFYDKCIVEVRSLESLGKATDGGFLHHIIMKQIPYDLALEYSRKLDGSSQLVVDNLLEFIRKELESRERAQAFTKKNERGREHNYRETMGEKFRENSKEYRSKGSERYAFPQKPKKSTTQVLTNCSEVICPFCDAAHKAIDCKSKTLEEKIESLKSKRKCFRCLRGDHMSKRCNARIQCQYCNKRHHTAMCQNRDKDDKSKGEAEERHTTEEAGSHALIQREMKENLGGFLLQTATVVLNGSVKQGVARCLIDGGSQRSFIRKDISEELKLPVVGELKLNYFPFGASMPTTIWTKRVQIEVKSIHDEQAILIEAIETPDISAAHIQVPSKDIQQQLKKKGLKLAEDIKGKYPLKTEIGLLIGSDYYWKVFNTNVERLSESLVAMKTIFGWVVQGPTTTCLLMNSQIEEIETSATNLILETEVKENIGERLKVFWELESLGIVESGTKLSENHEEAIQRFESTIEKKEGRYQVRLPWVEEKPQLGNNYHMAHKRLEALCRRFRRDLSLFENYKTILQDYEDKGIIERVPKEEKESSTVYYIPHQPVIKQERLTTKVRIVFDASSHELNEPSLNECLLPGPNLNPDLLEVLIRFRMKRIAITSDIEQAFLQISIAPIDRNATRFLWDPNPFKEESKKQTITY